MEEEESSVNFIMLADGRRIAYEEKGVEKRMAKQSLLVLHGVPSSHIVGMLGKLFGFGEKKKTHVGFVLKPFRFWREEAC
jgi:hypothetical protein